MASTPGASHLAHSLVNGRIGTIASVAAWVRRSHDAGRIELDAVRAQENVLYPAMGSDPVAIFNALAPYLWSPSIRELRWTRWESELHDEMTVYSPDHRGQLARVLTLALLRLNLAHLTPDRVALSHELLFLLDGEQSLLIQQLEALERTRASWTHLLPTDGNDSFSLLRSRFAAIATEVRSRFTASIARAAISPARVTRVANEARETFLGGSVLRAALIWVDAWSTVRSPFRVDDTYFGVNTVTDKEPFVDVEGGIEASGLGSSYGHSMALSYDRRLAADLLSRSTHTESCASDDIDRVLTAVRSREGEPRALLIVGGTLGLTSRIWGHKQFVPSHGDSEGSHLHIPGYYGRLAVDGGLGVVVLRTVIDELKTKGLLLLANGGVAVREVCPVPTTTEAGALAVDPLFVWIRAFSENEALMQRMTERPPAWLAETSPVERRALLATKAWIQVLSHFDVAANDGGAAITFEWSGS